MPTHAEKRTLRYTPDQMFDLVADVRRYPEFLPWCVGARLITQTETELVADLTIGFKLFRETFRSRVQLERPNEVRVQYENGPFRYLNNTWKFHPIEGGTQVDFFVDFEFRSSLLQAVIGVVFNEVRVQYENGPFRYLNNTWKFHPIEGGTQVDFFVDFEFRSSLLQAVIGVVFNEAVRLMVRSFERRAMALYGRNPVAATAGSVGS